MSDAPRSTRPLWVAIAVLAVGLGVALYFLVDRSPAPSASAPPTSPPTPSAAHPPATQPTQASPLSPDPKEVAARERLLVISHALDLHFRQRYDFPDRLEVLIANDLLKPVDLDDPWHRPVDYTRVAKERFKLCSRGPDATSWTDDDICIGPGGRAERPGR